MKKFKIGLVLLVFIINLNANDCNGDYIECKSLSMSKGLHQHNPYNNLLTEFIVNDNYRDTGKRITSPPLVGCVPLSISRSWAFLNKKESTFKIQRKIATLHQNSSEYIYFTSNGTWVENISDVRKIIANSGLISIFRPISTEIDKRKRISNFYIWIKEKIDSNMPVIAGSSIGSHAFLIDGYKKENPVFGSEDLYIHALIGHLSTDDIWIQIDKGTGYEWFEFLDNEAKKWFDSFKFEDIKLLAVRKPLNYGEIVEHQEARGKVYSCFPDINQAEQLYKYGICHLKENGLVDGYPNGDYRPNNLINRAEFLKIITNARESTMEQPMNILNFNKRNNFSDVAESDWFTPYIAYGVFYNIVEGYTDGTFKPAQNINFAEAAKIIVITLVDSNITKKNADDWYEPFITKLKSMDINTFDPSHKVTRGEMAYLISSVLNWEGK